MKQISVNLCAGGVCKTLTSHYFRAGWTDFIRFPNPIPHPAVMVIDNDTDTNKPRSGRSQHNPR